MKVIKYDSNGDLDFTLFINNQEAEKLEKDIIMGELYNREWPYDNLKKKIILRLAEKGERTNSYGCCYYTFLERPDSYREFCIAQRLYERLKENGRIFGARYDGRNKMDVVNYEIEKVEYYFQMKDLDLLDEL
ncbi:MAG: hypothetical protein KAT28_04715 [Candidatus Aenigmarchaeota archaeon]|nr:hypothetical protein [Candidatus Aenigmarchaeota archaeon]